MPSVVAILWFREDCNVWRKHATPVRAPLVHVLYYCYEDVFNPTGAPTRRDKYAGILSMVEIVNRLRIAHVHANRRNGAMSFPGFFCEEVAKPCPDSSPSLLSRGRRVRAVCPFLVRAQTGAARQTTWRFAFNQSVFGKAECMTMSEFANHRHKRECSSLRRFCRIVVNSSVCVWSGVLGDTWRSLHGSRLK